MSNFGVICSLLLSLVILWVISSVFGWIVGIVAMNSFWLGGIVFAVMAFIGLAVVSLAVSIIDEIL